MSVRIIDKIRQSLNNINPQGTGTIAEFPYQYEEFYVALLCNKATKADFDALCTKYMSAGDMRGVLIMHYLAIELGWQNDASLKWVLDNMPQVNYIPGTWDSGTTGYMWLMYDAFALLIFIYSATLNHQTAKWKDNIRLAYNEFKGQCKWGGHSYEGAGVMACNATYTFVGGTGPRTYDETLQTARTFMEFYIRYIDNPDATLVAMAEDALVCAETLANFTIVDGTGIYQTPPDPHGDWHPGGWFVYGLHDQGTFETMECESSGIWTLLAKINALKGYGTNYESYVNSDIWAKHLIDGWNSPMWLNYFMRHSHTNNSEMRLMNTVMTAEGWQGFWGWLNTTNKGKIRDMLLGNAQKGITRWADAITSPSSPLYQSSTGKWCWDNMYANCFNARGAAQGIVLLWMNAIIPDEASLLIPISKEFIYESWYLLRPGSYKLDVDNNELQIIVNTLVADGKMQLWFGSAPITVTFPTNGVYSIKFKDNTWNELATTNPIIRLGDVPPDIYAQNVADTQPPPPDKYIITVNQGPSGNASISPPSPGNQYEAGTTVTITWSPTGSGYTFLHWNVIEKDGTQGQRSGPAYDLLVDGAYTFTPELSEQKVYAIDMRQATGGTTTPLAGMNIYSANEQVQVSATPNEGYKFDSWTMTDPNGNTTYPTQQSFPLTVDGLYVLTPHFIQTECSITMVSATGGTTTPAGGTTTPYNYNELATIIATPNTSENYVFEKWTILKPDGSTDEPTNYQYSFNVVGKYTVTPHFKKLTEGEFPLWLLLAGVGIVGFVGVVAATRGGGGAGAEYRPTPMFAPTPTPAPSKPRVRYVRRKPQEIPYA